MYICICISICIRTYTTHLHIYIYKFENVGKMVWKDVYCVNEMSIISSVVDDWSRNGQCE